MDNENLYSLELYVYSVSNLQISCLLPVIAFKFLDFPVSNIYLVSQTLAEKIKDKLDGTEIPDVIEDLDDLKDEEGNFHYNKGKSCLFKMKVDELYKGVGNIPIQVYLFDSWTTPMSLHGTMLLPLLDTVKKTFDSSAKREGFETPTVFSQRKRKRFYNLMGTEVATVDLVWKLTDYGNCLARHIQTKQLSFCTPKVEILVNTGHVGREVKENLGNHEVSVPDIKERQTLKGIRNSAKTKQKDRVEVTTNTSVYGRYDKKNQGTQTQVGNRTECKYLNSNEPASFDYGMRQPPPLFYNASKRTEKHTHAFKSELMYHNRMDDRPESNDFGQGKASPYISCDYELLKPTAMDGVFSIQRQDRLGPKDVYCQTDNVDKEDVVLVSDNSTVSKALELPTLRALMKDILSFYHMTDGHGVYNPSLENRLFSEADQNKSKQKVTSTEISNPKSRLIHHDHTEPVKNKQTAINRLKNDSKQTKNRRPLAKKSSVKDAYKVKSKLKFGLTRTHMLRYAQTHKDGSDTFDEAQDQVRFRMPENVKESRNSHKQSIPSDGRMAVLEDLHITSIVQDERKSREWFAGSQSAESSHTRRESNSKLTYKQKDLKLGTFSNDGGGDGVAKPVHERFSPTTSVTAASTFSSITGHENPYFSSEASKISLHVDMHAVTRSYHEIGSQNVDFENTSLVSSNGSGSEIQSNKLTEKEEVEPSWQDDKPWTDSLMDSREIDKPIPSTFSPAASKSTRRNPRPTLDSNTSDLPYDQTTSSVWSTHDEKKLQEMTASTRETSESPRAIEVQDLYSDDFDEAGDEEEETTRSQQSFH